MTLARLYLCATMAIAGIALTACGGSGLGSDTGPTPLAVITPIGYKAETPSGASTPEITVRAGANVVLSAKDSDGRGIALSGWTWTQTTTPALPQPPDVRGLLYLTDNTVSFRAPEVTQATDLGFQVKVTNAQDASSTAQITVHVLPAEDPDRFLMQPRSAPRFTIAVLAADGLGTSPAAPLSARVPVCVAVQRTVVYTARDGSRKSVPLPQLDALKADATWAAGTVVQAVNPATGTIPSAGTAAYDANVQTAVGSYSNPRVVFDIPEFNDEELLAKYNQPSTADTSMQLVSSDIDSAQLELTLVATPGSCDGAPPPAAFGTTQLVIAVLDSTGQTVVADSGPGTPGGPVDLAVGGVTAANSSQQLTPDWLLSEDATGQPVENQAMAEAYYEGIDPQAKDSSGAYIDPAMDPTKVSRDSKATLTGWLQDNCFDPNSSDYGTAAAGADGAHATYTNNYDLGFGRDMYFVRCTASYIAAHPGVTAQPGDVASVVINYQDLEHAAAKDNPLLAVAMEWSLDGSTGKHVTKFYVYAPDDRTGTFYRVLSANFDGRGQKYVPNSCMACHGGVPPAIPDGFASGMAYPASHGDVDSAFLPFDLDSFLYSDTDPAFSGQLALKSGYTRAAEEPKLKALNAFVYQIYTDSTECETAPPGQVAGPTDPCATQSNEIDRFAAAKALVEKWYGGAPTDPSNGNSYCDNASCEHFGYPATPSGWSGQDSVYHNVFARNCRTCHTLNSAIGDQFSSSQTFLSLTKSTPYTLDEGLMPDARLTMDRFWADYNGGSTSAGQTLAQSLAATPKLGDPSVNSSSPTVTNSDTPVRVDAADSYFLAGYSWALAFEPTTPGTGTPDCSSPAADGQLVGATTAEPAFLIDQPGCYTLTLTPPDAPTQAVYEQTFSVAANALQLSSAPASGCPGAPTAYTSAASSTSVSLSGCLVAAGNPPYSLTLSADGGATWSSSAVCGASSVTGPGGAWTACESCPQSAIPAAGIAAGACDQIPSVQVTFGSAATAGTVASLLLDLCDANGNCVPTSPATTPVLITLGNPPIFSLGMPNALTFYWTDGTGNGLTGSGIPICGNSSNCANSPPFMAQTPYGDATIDISSYVGVQGSAWSLKLTPPASLTASPVTITNSDVTDLGAVTLQGFSSPLACTSCGTLNSTLDSGIAGGTTGCSTTSSPTTFTSGASACQTTLDVVPLAGFSGQVYQQLASSCSSGCHGSTANATAQSFWKFDSSSVPGTYDCIASGTSCALGLVSPNDPSGSPFYTACANGAGSMLPLGASSQVCKTIYQWIFEGALKN